MVVGTVVVGTVVVGTVVVGTVVVGTVVVGTVVVGTVVVGNFVVGPTYCQMNVGSDASAVLREMSLPVHVTCYISLK